MTLPRLQLIKGRNSRVIRKLRTRPGTRRATPNNSTSITYTVDGEYWEVFSDGSTPKRVQDQWDDCLEWLRERRIHPDRSGVVPIGVPAVARGRATAA